jgi:protein-disulfide isomerase
MQLPVVFGILEEIILYTVVCMDEMKPIVTMGEEHAGKSCCGTKGSCRCGSESEEKGAWIVAGAVLLSGLMVAASILVSMKPGTATPGAAPSAAQNAAAPSGAQAGPQTAIISLDDDPVMGDRKKAKVAIVEFSDFECPFCQKFHKDSYDILVKEYVDTGKAVISFRDYPLPFHEPKASVASELAQCVKEAKGDIAYFKFSKLYFENTVSNGKGVADDKMNEILQQSGVNAASVKDCASKEKFKDEIAKDMSDGQAAGVSGTPSFVIGKLTADGKVEGELVVGALPLAQFKAAVDKYLK